MTAKVKYMIWHFLEVSLADLRKYQVFLIRFHGNHFCLGNGRNGKSAVLLENNISWQLCIKYSISRHSWIWWSVFSYSVPGNFLELSDAFIIEWPKVFCTKDIWEMMIIMEGDLESGEKQIGYHHPVYDNLNQTHLIQSTITRKDILQKKRWK